MFEPIIRMASEFTRSLGAVVASPRPKEVPRPGTVELCHIRAWLLNADHAQAGGKELFDRVVFFVIESRATKVGHGSRMHYDLSVPLLPERPLPRVPDPIGDHVHRRLQFQFFPSGRVRPAILDACLSVSMRQQFEAIGSLWAKPPA